MPIYEFHCPACGHRFQRLCTWSERDNMLCPSCGKKTKRIMSTFAVSGGQSSDSSGSTSSGGGCAGCSGRSCSTCH